MITPALWFRFQILTWSAVSKSMAGNKLSQDPFKKLRLPFITGLVLLFSCVMCTTIAVALTEGESPPSSFLFDFPT